MRRRIVNSFILLLLLLLIGRHNGIQIIEKVRQFLLALSPLCTDRNTRNASRLNLRWYRTRVAVQISSKSAGFSQHYETMKRCAAKGWCAWNVDDKTIWWHLLCCIAALVRVPCREATQKMSARLFARKFPRKHFLLEVSLIYHSPLQNMCTKKRNSLRRWFGRCVGQSLQINRARRVDGILLECKGKAL